MKKLHAIILLFTLFLIGGCGDMDNTGGDESKKPSEMNPEELPQIQAFQDEASRELMVSTEPEEEGFYLMESPIGAYTMWFPEEAVFLKNGSGSDGDHYDKVRFAYESNAENKGYIADFEYFLNGIANYPDRSLDAHGEKWGYADDWKELEHEGAIIHYGSLIRETEHGNEIYVIGFKVKEDDKPQATQFSYISSCLDKEQDNCELNLEKEEEFVLEWVKSINYLKETDSGGNSNEE
ncbi:hypothetical protein [Alkalicoccobacillus porphyridii]|uniref:Lipoprotein n=1 Tax=Alkalicoccobacillus porphyridii TaxID=2597270 RepID=A0A553ZW79_9BACI|nr:hypothetical protein [Alkalicoccobacillus porphyridii]TSB45730.1 hypothetical protein FN960_14680 [Alkalicoccobacillus porphyridii]